jgi:hypothetical protein
MKRKPLSPVILDVVSSYRFLEASTQAGSLG